MSPPHRRFDGAQQLHRWLGELGVAATPGLDFDVARGVQHVRFSYAGDERRPRRGVRAAADWQPERRWTPAAQRAARRPAGASTCRPCSPGPNCARYLADFGADVIKVERPDGGDSLRNMAWRDPRDGDGPVVEARQPQQAHDRARPQGPPTTATLLLRLVDDADVLVENFRPGTLERLGLGPDVLLARNPGS